jgi:NDP-sugar pyrophosphorylase family protein
MLPLGDRPVMERIISRLRDSGIRRVNITTHYRPESIASHFGDGSEFGVCIRYVNEESPLGTAGALALLDAPAEPVLVINGDVICDVDFRAILSFHHEHEADLTVAVRPHTIRIPFGVVEAEGSNIRAIHEKPTTTHLVNAGIYLLDPSVYPHLPPSGPFEMTDLIRLLIEAGRRVVGFPIREYWRDIGRHDEYAQAQADMAKGGCAI